jgi:uncharacterized integral membrane protein
MSIPRTRSEFNGQNQNLPPDAVPMVAADPAVQPTQPAPELVPAPGHTPELAGEPAPPMTVPHTRAGAAWVALVTAALLTVLLIIFLVQNTRSTEISFLWMTTRTPVAVALLIAAVGSVLLTLILGTARIAQLRRLVRKQRNTS